MYDGNFFVLVLGLTVFVTCLLRFIRSILKSQPRPELEPELELTKTIDPDGYVVLLPINEREHRYVARHKIGRNLTPDEHVHHISGIKTDNEIENLCLMDGEKHEHFHAWLRWKKEKDGMYPSINDQKRVLAQEYGGTLLETVTRRQGKHCPDCNSPMVLRTAKRGKSRGSQFWGCSRYPKCRSSLAA